MKTPAQLAAEVVRNRAEELARLRERVDCEPSLAGDIYRPVAEPIRRAIAHAAAEALRAAADEIADCLKRDPDVSAREVLKVIDGVADALHAVAAGLNTPRD